VCNDVTTPLLAALGHDVAEYQEPDPESATEIRAADIAALARWSHTEFGPLDLIADVPLPPDADLDAMTDTLKRGRAELADLLRSFAQEPAEAAVSLAA
jgi:hypothetical protein